MNKKNAIDLLNRKHGLGLDDRNTRFSNVNSGKRVWWFEPKNAQFQDRLNIILCNAEEKKIYFFVIPENKIQNPAIYFVQKQEGVSHIEIKVDDKKYQDILMHPKGICFDEYLKDVIEY
jgi:hypothetical protein